MVPASLLSPVRQKAIICANPALRYKCSSLLKEVKTEFGWSSGLIASLGGRYILGKIRREEKRLAEAGHMNRDLL